MTVLQEPKKKNERSKGGKKGTKEREGKGRWCGRGGVRVEVLQEPRRRIRKIKA